MKKILMIGLILTLFLVSGCVEKDETLQTIQLRYLMLEGEEYQKFYISFSDFCIEVCGNKGKEGSTTIEDDGGKGILTCLCHYA